MAGDIEKLGAAIEREVTARISKKVRAARDRGETVTFGPFALAPDGLAFKYKQLPWSKLASFRLQEGFIRVFEQGKKRAFASALYATTPNVRVLLGELSRHAPAATERAPAARR